MYARLCATSSSPSVCLICTHLSRLRRHLPSDKRHYAAQAALATRPPQSTSIDPGPSDQGPSASLSTSNHRGSLENASGSLKKDSQTKAARAKAKAGKVARKIMKEAEDAERRRKALAVLGKTSKFAAALNETIDQPTLVDLEQLRPKDSPIVTLEYISPNASSGLHHGSPSDAAIERYSSAFQELTETLTQKFTRKQLLSMYREGKQHRSGVQIGTPRPMGSLKSRQDAAGEIVRWLWQWPYVTEVRERKAYLTERSQRVFSIGASELFLLLGRDGSSLLGLTKSFKVVIKQVVPTHDAFSLVIEGPNHILDRLAVVLTERKKAILSKVFTVDVLEENQSSSSPGASSVRPDLLQRISKLSDALVEDTGNGQFRISSRRARNIESATRLTARAWQQTALPPPLLLVHLPTSGDTTMDTIDHHTYSLFPLELPKAASLPWSWTPTGKLFSTSSSSGASEQDEHSPSIVVPPGTPNLFRARMVSDWLGRNVSSNLSHLRDGLGRLLGSTGELRTIRDALSLLPLDAAGMQSDAGYRKQITASSGFVVVASNAGSRNTLLPPFPGSWIIQNLLDWMGADQGRMSFIPSLPQPLVRSTLSDQSPMTRLVYRSVVPEVRAAGEPLAVSDSAGRSKAIKIVLSARPTIPVQDATEVFDSNSPENGRNTTYDDHLLYNESPSRDMDRSVSPSHLEVLSGVESFVNLMMPDRPMDMQFSVFDSTPVPSGSEPQEIRTYASSLFRYLCSPNVLDQTLRPDPPLHLTHEGTRYVLDSNAVVRRSFHRISEIERPTDVMTEHVVELESDQQIISCQVICTEPDTSSAWQTFLEDCDGLNWLRGEDAASSPNFSEHGSVDGQEA